MKWGAIIPYYLIIPFFAQLLSFTYRWWWA